ncbi:MAG: FAD-dependent oxidoreductase [Hyphomicrobiaceae bacterium]
MTAEFLEQRSVTSWGRIKRQRVAVARPQFGDELPRVLQQGGASSLLGVGAGRSYGDSGLNERGGLVDMTSMDRILAFDRERGTLRAEAGLMLGEILRIVVPRGYFLPTTPGTRFVTLGGAVANDVHGKNHHRAGTFGVSVTRLGMHRSDAGDIEIAPDENAALFSATVGGLGLTGLIHWVEFKLHPIKSAWLAAETVPFSGVGEFLSVAAASTADWEHTVAWIDCTSGGRSKGVHGLFSRANFLAAGTLDPHKEHASASLPVEVPAGLINRWTLKAFNRLYYAAGCRKRGLRLVHYAPFFYPLDAVRNWNRAYGRSGFYQYQCVIPMASAEPAIAQMLLAIAASGEGSALAVLKTFGNKPSPGMLSFPFEGVTLALDFANRSSRTLELFNRLDWIVAQAGGRLYPAKDGRMPASMFRAGYPMLDRFTPHIDPRFRSDFWRRMSA